MKKKQNPSGAKKQASVNPANSKVPAVGNNQDKKPGGCGGNCGGRCSTTKNGGCGNCSGNCGGNCKIN